jgi:hypothetical protein
VAVFDGADNFFGDVTGAPGDNFGVLPGLTSTNGFVIKFGPDAEFNGINNIAFSVTPIPEPSTYALMLAGLGVVGFAARRRQRAAAAERLAAV